MSVGLDLGTTEFRSIRDSGGELISRSCQAQYLVVKETPGHRRLLENTHARHATCGDDLIVFGDDAAECAAMLDLPMLPLLRSGLLPSGDPVARQIVALTVEAVLPQTHRHGEICCLTIPGGYELNEDHQSLDVRFLKQLVSLRGYSPQLISAGHATVLAELSEASFSGLGISLGATNCEFALIHCGRELGRCSIAGQIGELTEELLLHDQRSELDQAKQETWMRDFQRQLTAIFTEARDTLLINGSLKLMPQPTNVVCTGGITGADGFVRPLQLAWNRSNWPIKTSQIRIAPNPRFTIARGGLIQAILGDEQHLIERQVA
ncbi:MAG: hypothetical protein JWP89_707 [Schlesneria sp.]|nr:hypothetical protein [Schlesneria sp.]